MFRDQVLGVDPSEFASRALAPQGENPDLQETLLPCAIFETTGRIVADTADCRTHCGESRQERPLRTAKSMIQLYP